MSTDPQALVALKPYTCAEDVQIGDIVRRVGTGIGGDLLRVSAIYDGDEIVVETTGSDWSGVGDAFDLCWFDVEFVERRHSPSPLTQAPERLPDAIF